MSFLKSLQVTICGGMILGSCGIFGGGSDLCESRVSVSDVVVSLQLGLDNVSEDQYSQLRISFLDAYDATQVAAEELDETSGAEALLLRIEKFVTAMDEVSWDVSRAIEDNATVTLATELSSAESLMQANEVEMFLIDKCGTTSTLASPTQTQETLPSPSVPKSDETLPDTNAPNENSEALALGRTIADAFSLTLSESEVLCLGQAVAGVYDITGNGNSITQYNQQFQKAFDTCGIDFSIAAEEQDKK